MKTYTEKEVYTMDKYSKEYIAFKKEKYKEYQKWYYENKTKPKRAKKTNPLTQHENKL